MRGTLWFVTEILAIVSLLSPLSLDHASEFKSALYRIPSPSTSRGSILSTIHFDFLRTAPSPIILSLIRVQTSEQDVPQNRRLSHPSPQENEERGISAIEIRSMGPYVLVA